MTQLPIEANRRYSPMKFTKSNLERSQMYSPSKRNINNRLYTNRYYCHYSNAVYMGGADSFKKSGPGILLLDSGACAITNHSHDNMTDFNIIFRDKSLTLMTVKTNRSKYVTHRVGCHLFTMHFNSRGSIDRPCYLADFKQKKLFRLTYFGAKVDKKQQILDKRVLNNIFSLFDYSDIIEEPNHLKCLNLQFNIYPEIHSKRDGSIFKIGYFQQSNKEELGNGLAFTANIHDQPEQFDVILQQRGYYHGKKMQKFGQKHFENGNYYIGGFKNGLFDGYGLLVHPQQSKWTYSVHRKGQIVELLQSSVTSKLRLSQLIKRIHEYDDTYIKDYVKFSPSALQISEVLAQATQTEKNGEDLLDSFQLNQKKINNYRTIREDFVSRQYQQNTQQIIQQQLSSEKKSSFKPFVQSLPIKQIINSAKKKQQKNQLQRSREKSSKALKANKNNDRSKKKQQQKEKEKEKGKEKQKSILKNEEYVISVKSPAKKKEQQVSPLKITNKKKEQETNKYLIIEDKDKDLHSINMMTAQSSHRTPKRNQTNNQYENKEIPYHGAAHILNNRSEAKPQYRSNIPKISESFQKSPGYQFRDYSLYDYLNQKRYQPMEGLYSNRYVDLQPGFRTPENELEGRSSRQSSIDKNCLSRKRHFKYIDDLDQQEYIGRRMTMNNYIGRSRYRNQL